MGVRPERITSERMEEKNWWLFSFLDSVRGGNLGNREVATDVVERVVWFFLVSSFRQKKSGMESWIFWYRWRNQPRIIRGWKPETAVLKFILTLWKMASEPGSVIIKSRDNKLIACSRVVYSCVKYYLCIACKHFIYFTLACQVHKSAVGCDR